LRRGDIYIARLDPVEGSEQAGTRPVVLVSRDIVHERGRNVIAVPLTTYRGQPLAPSNVLVSAGDGGLTQDSVALAEQVRVLSKTRLGRHWGAIAVATLEKIDHALKLALDLE